jgi:hypothetical protein
MCLIMTYKEEKRMYPELRDRIETRRLDNVLALRGHHEFSR